jgi:hypothetical protein
MTTNYKIETKNSLFQVTLEKGVYSDYRKAVLVFSATSHEHVWRIICELHKNRVDKETTQLGELTTKQYLDIVITDTLESKEFGSYPAPYTGNYLSDPYETIEITIKKLNVIYTNF